MIRPEEHIGLVRKCVRRWLWATSSPAIAAEDLEQEGMKGVIRAAETFDESKGRWATYAVPWINHFIRREVHRQVRTVRVPFARARKAYGEGESFPLASTPLDEAPASETSLEADNGEFLEDQDRKELVSHLLSTLPERESTILRLRFFEEMTLFEAGRALGISSERARQLQERALGSLGQRALAE